MNFPAKMIKVGTAVTAENKKEVWLINQYANPPDVGTAGRHYYFACELAKQGFSVALVTSSYNHLMRFPPKVSEKLTQEVRDGYRQVWVRVGQYANAHSTGRILNWIQFAWCIRKLPDILKNKPAAILCSSPSIFSFLGARYLAKRTNARLIFEVRDIWPLTLIELGGLSRHNPFVMLLQCIEDYAYKSSEKVVSNLPNAVQHMVERGMDPRKFVWIPNGITEDEVRKPEPLDENVFAQIPRDSFLVGYAGTLGKANAIEHLIEAAWLLREKTEIKFVIVGNGRDKSNLLRLAQDRELNNVVFIDTIPKRQIQSILSVFDVCFIGWRNERLYDYGIAANKLTDYLVSGKPVLHSYSGSNDLVKIYKAGVSVPAEEPAEIARGVVTLYEMNEKERQRLGANGRRAAWKYHDYRELATKLATVLQGQEPAVE